MKEKHNQSVVKFQKNGSRITMTIIKISFHPTLRSLPTLYMAQSPMDLSIQRRSCSPSLHCPTASVPAFCKI
jgi:hypothetical protein